MSVHIIGNPAAGTGDGVSTAATVARLLDGTLHSTRSADDARTLATDLVADGADRIVVCGGDGLVHLVGQAVAGSDTVLGIVPVGTGNDIARGLHIEPGTVEAMAATAASEPVPVDAIATEHGWALSVATLGFAADVNQRADNLRWPRGSARYTLATVLELPRLKPKRMTVTVDGTTHEVETLLFAAANTPYFGGGMAICPDAVADDGKIDLTIVGPVPLRTFARVFPQSFKGNHVLHPAVATDRGAVVELDGHGLELWADGEVLGPLPVTLRAVPGALQVAGALP